MKLEIETFRIFMSFLKCSTEESMNRFFRRGIRRVQARNQEFVRAGENETQEQKTEQGKLSGFFS